MVNGFALSISLGLQNTDVNSEKNKCPNKLTPEDPYILKIAKSCDESLLIHSLEVGEWVVVCKGESFSQNKVVEQLCGIVGASDSALDSDLIDQIRAVAGQYCAVCFNKKDGRLIEVTDPSGIHSLFYTESKKNYFVASSLYFLKEIVADIDLKPDKNLASFFFRYAYFKSGESVYENVNEITPNIIRVDNVFSEASAIIYHYKLISPELNVDNSGSYSKQLVERLKYACKQQIGDAKNVGVLLGGFDSALVVSLLKGLDVNVETYSFCYEDKTYNQPFADELSKELGIAHHWININSEVIREGISQYEVSSSWPTMWLNYVIQTQHLCKKMHSDGMEVCFSGDGCDAAFMGYPSTHKRGEFYKKIPRLPKWIIAGINNIMRLSRVEFMLGHICRVMYSLLDASGYGLEERPLYSFQVIGKNSASLMFKEKYYSEDYREHFIGMSEKHKSLSFERKMYFAKSLVSPNRCKIVSSSDVSGLQIYSPYMHPAVTEFAAELPDDALRPEKGQHIQEGKYILMSMAKEFNLLSSDIIYQNKVAAIYSPIDDWMREDLSFLINEKIKNLPYKINSRYIDSLIDQTIVDKIYKKYFSNDGVITLALSLLLTTSVFFNKNE